MWKARQEEYKELATCEKPGLGRGSRGGGAPSYVGTGGCGIKALRFLPEENVYSEKVGSFPWFTPLFESESVDFTPRWVFSRSFLVGVFYAQKKEQLRKAVVGAIDGLAGLWLCRSQGAL